MSTPRHECDAPFMQEASVDEAVAKHYATVRFSEDFVCLVRSALAAAVDDHDQSKRIMKEQFEIQLKELARKEENLVSLAEDGVMPSAKVRDRLRDVARQRGKIDARMNDLSSDLAKGIAYVEGYIELLTDPEQLYRNSSDSLRKSLNQAIFERIFVVSDEFLGNELKEPLAEMLTAQRIAIASGHVTKEIKRTALDEGGSSDYLTSLWLTSID